MLGISQKVQQMGSTTQMSFNTWPKPDYWQHKHIRESKVFTHGHAKRCNKTRNITLLGMHLSRPSYM